MKYSENYINLHTQSFTSYYQLACVYAFRGDKEKVYENLKRFTQVQSVTCSTVLSMDHPLFDSIRNEPEFQKILKDVEDRFKAEHEKIKKWLEENKMV